MFKHARIPEKEVLKRLLDELQVADNRSAAFHTFCKAMADIGFDGSMFISRATGNGWTEDIAETTYPKAWVDHYIDAGYTRTDPARKFALLHPVPFFWSEIFPHIRGKNMRVFNEAKEFGLAAGLSVPIYDAGTLVGVIGVSSKRKNIEDVRLKSSIGIAAQIFCTVYNQIVREENETPYSPPVQQPLTKRELEILMILAKGLNKPEIADALHISQSAVAYHIKNIFLKLGVDSRVSAAVKGIKLGLIEPE
jgi:DNA-binding CsgD family transcriptional regulator